jgi:hypothetical protein
VGRPQPSEQSGKQRSGKQQPNENLSVAQILKNNAGQYVAQYPGQAAPQVQSTLAKLSLCRTAALGGHQFRCGTCAQVTTVHNSCGDRYCPTCSGARKSDWLESTGELIFDGVDHFQVVFTLPSELSRLALGNRKPIYDLLFASAWSALKQTIESEHGFDPAALLVLHTWNQKLDAHAHVHVVVPGCGPALDGTGVRFAQRGDDETSRGRYLVDAEQLRQSYREIFLKGLDRLHRNSALKLEGEFESLKEEENWAQLLADLEAATWVSYIQPPPQPGQDAGQVLKYLARYLAGGPISDHRIVSTSQTEVTFMARQGETVGGDRKQVPITLSQVEFTRRWSLHVLPAGYTRTRRFGGWSNIRRELYLERWAKQLDAAEVPLSPEATEFGPFDELAASDCDEQVDSPGPCCQCGGPLIPQRIRDKPAWSNVMASQHRPPWYLWL